MVQRLSIIPAPWNKHLFQKTTETRVQKNSNELANCVKNGLLIATAIAAMFPNLEKCIRDIRYYTGLYTILVRAGTTYKYESPYRNESD